MAEILGPDGRPLAIFRDAPLNENWASYVSSVMQVMPNMDMIRLRTYEEMLDTDESVSSGVEFAVLAALCKLGEYTNSKKRIQKAVRDQLAAMPGSFPVAVGEIGTAVPFGFSVTEILWRYEGSKYNIGGLQTLSPHSIDFEINTAGPQKNKIKTIWQWRGRGPNYEAVIPNANAIVYSHNMRFGNWYGRSRLKAAYPVWFLKKVMMKSWGYGMQRYANPISWMKVGQPNQTILSGGKTYTAFEWAQRQLESLSTKSSIVHDGSSEFGLQYPDRPFGTDYENIVGYCNKMIYRACLLPALVADAGNAGSYALGGVHYDMFDLANEKLLNEMEQFLIEQLVRPFIEFNFGPQNSYGRFDRRKLKTQDLKLLAQFVQLMTASNYLSDQDLDDLNHVRALAGMPLRDTVYEKKPQVPSVTQSAPADPNAPPADAPPKGDPAKNPPKEDPKNAPAGA